MKSNYRIILFTVLIGLVLFTKVYMALPHKGHTSAKETQQTDKPPAPPSPAAPPQAPGDHQTIIDPNTSLIFTKHAKCRMECRHISEADIREVLREGHVNEAKSKQEEGKCPAYAIEDNRNSDGVRLRIVFAKCDHDVKVVTCIDRDDEFACDCK